jgi:hypothetical protein
METRPTHKHTLVEYLHDPRGLRRRRPQVDLHRSSTMEADARRHLYARDRDAAIALRRHVQRANDLCA